MKNLIENTITWTKIGKHSKSEYRYVIEKAAISKENLILNIDMRLNFVVPFSDVLRIKALIQNQITDLKGVEINFIYEDVILTEQEIVTLFIEHMIYIVNGAFAPITKTIFPDKFLYKKENLGSRDENAQEHNDKLIIYALVAVAFSELNEKVAVEFKQ